MTVCPSEQYENICKGEFASVHTKLDRMDESIRGNGKPGINTRLDRLEQDAKRQARLIWLVVGAAVTLAASSAWHAVFGG
jgi:hypothetical protein